MKTTSIHPQVNTVLRLEKDVSSAFERLNNSLHQSADRTFDDLLEFILNEFQIGGKGLKHWTYTKEQTALFLDMFSTIVRAMKEVLTVKPWYDFFGKIYELQVAGLLRKQGAGQFFTPMHVVDLMTKIVALEKKDSVYDPCCGSGRMLLAAHAENPEAMLYAQDLDRTCVMMTTCNFLLHGCRGVVTWGNSLVPADKREVWLINPYGELVQEGITHCVLSPDIDPVDSYVEIL